MSVVYAVMFVTVTVLGRIVQMEGDPVFVMQAPPANTLDQFPSL